MSKLAKSLDLQVFDIPMGMFEFSVRIVTGDYDNAKKYASKIFELKDYEEFEDNFEPRGRCFYRNGYIPIIWIPVKPESPRDYAVLAHEALHSVWCMFDWVGMPMTRDTEEVSTHAMAHIITEALEHFKERDGHTTKRT